MLREILEDLKNVPSYEDGRYIVYKGEEGFIVKSSKLKNKSIIYVITKNGKDIENVSEYEIKYTKLTGSTFK